MSGTMLHWTGSAWAPVAVGTTNFSAVWGFGTGTDDVWVVGAGGTILKKNGTMWMPQASGATYGLWGVWGSSATDVWAVEERGTILRYFP